MEVIASYMYDKRHSNRSIGHSMTIHLQTQKSVTCVGYTRLCRTGPICRPYYNFENKKQNPFRRKYSKNR